VQEPASISATQQPLQRRWADSTEGTRWSAMPTTKQETRKAWERPTPRGASLGSDAYFLDKPSIILVLSTSSTESRGCFGLVLSKFWVFFESLKKIIQKKIN